jgi:hypothetical protein
MRQFVFVNLVLSLFIVNQSSCSFDNGNKIGVTGEVGQILVVSDTELWDGAFKECLDSNLTQWIMPYLPDVATFELIHKTRAHFSKGVKRYRNILFIDLDPEFKGAKGTIVQRKDVWARGQLVVEITAKDQEMLVQTCSEGLDEVHDAFDKKSWQRIVKNFRGIKNKNLRSEVTKTFGIDLALPSNAKIVTRRKNFYRLEFPPASRPIEFAGTGTHDVGSVFSGLMIYQYDFIDSTQLEHQRLLRARDTMLKYNVPHEIDGLYMGTQYTKVVYPEGNIIGNESGTINGYEMRGMFKFTGINRMSTGGAFWAFHFVHPTTKKIVCLSGYVDAPATTSWTHPLREIQAILRSVELKK